MRRINREGGMKRPWMPLYIPDYLADTAHLSGPESGAYLHLLMHYWMHDGLPTDDASLCRIAKVHPPHWKRVRAVLEPFFGYPKTGGSWFQKRLEQDLTKAAEISNKRKDAALQKHSKSTANAVQMHTHQHPHSLKNYKKLEMKSGRQPPRHGATSTKYGTVYVRKGTSDWESYAEDYKRAHGFDPLPDDNGGKWFKTLGERVA